MIKTVISDMDGMLVDSEPKNLEQLREFYKSCGARVDDALIHSLIGSSYTHTYTESMRVMHMDWPTEEFKEELDSYCKLHAFGYDEILNPGIRGTLIWLREHGYKTAVTSNSAMHQIQTMESACDLVGCFGELLSGETFHESKPDPEVYLIAAKKLKMKPEKYTAIGDSSYGIAAGNAAGMRVLAHIDDRYSVDQSRAYARIHHTQEIKKYLND